MSPAKPRPLTLSLSKGELRRARLAASAVKGLTVKPGAGGRLLWYWEPNRAEKAAGWKPLAFAADRRAAQSGSETRNADIAAWRRGEDPPLSSPGFAGEGDHAQHGGGVSIPLSPILPAPRHRMFETLADHAHRYQSQYVAHLAPNTRRVMKSYLKLICALFGDLLPGDLQPHHIAQWTDAMRGRGVYTAQGRKVSDTTAHNRLRALSAFRNWIANPHEKFAMPKGRHQIWEADDRAAFIAAAFDLGLPGMAFAMQLAFYTGQRTQSLLQFTEAQLTEMKHLTDPEVRQALAGKDGKVWGWQFVQEKGHVPMHIPFEPDMLEALRSQLARNRAIDRAPKPDAAPPRLLTHVLVNPASGQPWLYRHFNRTWNKVKDHAVACTGRTNMDELHWHDFRRSRVVELKRQGFSHDRIATLSGHAADSINGIMKIYGPVDSNMTAALIADSAARTRQRGQG